MRILIWCMVFGCLYVLTACARNLPQPAVEPIGLPLQLVDEAVSVAVPGPTAVLGYLFAEGETFFLASRLGVSAEVPRPLEAPEQHLWLPDVPAGGLVEGLTTVGGVRYGLVRAEGLLEGPGSYGPNGQYRFQLRGATITPMAAQEITISALFEADERFNGQVIRVRGGLLMGSDESVLVEGMSNSGVPNSESRQIKLLSAVRDSALSARLAATPGGRTQYGPVLVEGLWRDGSLYPLAITATPP